MGGMEGMEGSSSSGGVGVRSAARLGGGCRSAASGRLNILSAGEHVASNSMASASISPMVGLLWLLWLLPKKGGTSRRGCLAGDAESATGRADVSRADVPVVAVSSVQNSAGGLSGVAWTKEATPACAACAACAAAGASAWEVSRGREQNRPPGPRTAVRPLIPRLSPRLFIAFARGCRLIPVNYVDGHVNASIATDDGIGYGCGEVLAVNERCRRPGAVRCGPARVFVDLGGAFKCFSSAQAFPIPQPGEWWDWELGTGAANWRRKSDGRRATGDERRASLRAGTARRRVWAAAGSTLSITSRCKATRHWCKNQRPSRAVFSKHSELFKNQRPSRVVSGGLRWSS